MKVLFIMRNMFSLPIQLINITLCVFRNCHVGTEHLIRGDGVQAFLASIQSANPSNDTNGENKEADTSTTTAPTNLFGADADESKDDNKMEE